MNRRYPISLLAATALALGSTAASAVPSTSGHDSGRSTWFERTATYPVFQNRPAGEDPATQTVAEISTVTPDGRTVIYTDAPGRRIGFVDISNPSAPRGLGTLALAQPGDAEAEPTSVTVVGGYVLVVVNTSKSFVAPSGRLDVIRISDRTRVRSIDLGGQPDSIALAHDGRYAAIAIENERDEEATPLGGEEGDLVQLPAGFVQIIDLAGSPDRWRNRPVPLVAANGSALPVLTRAGIVEPTDPEPEYVAISGSKLAVTLQENNGVVLIDLPTGRITRAFSAGTATVAGVDTKDDGSIDLSDTIVDVPREPDSIAWIADRYLATANEGDWKGGTRGWTVFDSRTGKVAWDSGNSFDRLAVAHGLYDDGRSDNKGSEPEGLATATVNGTPYAFVGSERGNFVAVYDLSKPTRPEVVQVLPTTNGPEGILPVPSRGLLVVSSETDDASVGVRASVAVYQIGRDRPTFPSVVADSLKSPIAWGALSGLAADPRSPKTLFAVTDAAYTPTRLLALDTTGTPARVRRELAVKDATGVPIGLDAEGVFVRPQGGFWLAVEGTAAKPADNRVLRLNAAGVVQQTVALPGEITAGLAGQGLEGVTAVTDSRGHEQVWVAVQRELKSDPKGTVRLGRYDVSTGAWAWFGYQLETTAAVGDWIGLSEITAIGRDRLAVIERDKLNGPAARIKRVYTVKVPSATPAAGTLPVLAKTEAVDLLPALRATRGWTQEKLEGFTVAGDGQAYAVTDNDGLDDATGETVFLRLGKVFGRNPH